MRISLIMSASDTTYPLYGFISWRFAPLMRIGLPFTSNWEFLISTVLKPKATSADSARSLLPNALTLSVYKSGVSADQSIGFPTTPETTAMDLRGIAVPEYTVFPALSVISNPTSLTPEVTMAVAVNLPSIPATILMSSTLSFSRV